MIYNWAGDVIERNTVVREKRCVVGYKDKFVTTDIREWVKPPPNYMLEAALLEIPNLPSGSDARSFDDRAWVIWEYVAEMITYIYDKKAHGLPDFWMFPEELLMMGRGDCEDSTYLLCSLLLASGISPFCVRAVLGMVYDDGANTLLGGHAWPIYLDEGGEWRLLESTLKAVPDMMPLANSLTMKGLRFRYEPMLCFNQHHLWRVKPSAIGIARHLELSKKRVNVEKAINRT